MIMNEMGEEKSKKLLKIKNKKQWRRGEKSEDDCCNGLISLSS